ncbi:hypothetical protein YPPY52_2998, partial [Yersinia pestis PY-52]
MPSCSGYHVLSSAAGGGA